MKPDLFYARLIQIAACEPVERYRLTAELHAHFLRDYLVGIRAIAREGAARRLPEGRTLAQVVGHIGDWDHCLALSAGEILTGVAWPSIMRLEGYVDPGGGRRSFAGIDDSNPCQAARQAGWTWPQVQAMALEAAQVVHALFTAPDLFTSERLERGRG
jgi:hypothetical protein